MTNSEFGSNPEDKENMKIEILEAIPENAHGILEPTAKTLKLD